MSANILGVNAKVFGMKAKIYGTFILFEAFFMLIASVVSLYYNINYGEDDAIPMLSATMITGIFGFFLLSIGREKSGRTRTSKEINSISMKNSFVIVTMTWVFFAAFGSLPFLFSNYIDNITDAFFESMSGFTTTGSTILTNIDSMPHGLLFWRSIIQWLGGLGIIVLFLAIIPAINKGSNKTMLFSAEATGLGVQKLHPKMSVTARRLWVIYIILTIICVLAYWAGPMDLYDAVCHAFTTIASGGFSTHQHSIGYYNSRYIEYIASLFMLMSGVNFSLYYLLICGKVSLFAKNEELRWFVGVVLVCVIVMTSLFYIAPEVGTVATDSSAYPLDTFESKFRTALFHVSAIISSTGYQAAYFDYTLWGGLFLVPTLLMMLSGACAGSTSGGIKIIREVICIKSINNTIKQILHPSAVFTVRISKEVVPNDMLMRTLNFLFFYIILCMASIVILDISGCSIKESVFNTITALSNMGPGVGSTGPASTFADLTDLAKWEMSFLMLVGRLEIFTVLLLFTPTFWDKK
ncbi:MAG: TrkH family potassium uptake protein [Bacteroidales bacterium]|nr:TrkH family potassium uptake protein [Bacteroidales bacterium]